MVLEKILTPERRELISQESIDRIKSALEYAGSVTEIVVQNDDQQAGAAKLAKEVGDTIKALNDDRKEYTSPLEKKKKALIAMYKDVTEPLENLRNMVRSAISVYYEEIERKRREQQRKLEEEARRKREAEERKAEEQRRKAEEQRKKAEEIKHKAQEAKDEEERRRAEKEAEKAERAADRWENKADEREMVAETIVAPEIKNEKIKGLSFRKDCELFVRNKIDVVTWCINSGMLHLIQIDEGKLKKIILDSDFQTKIPGVDVKKKKIAVTR